MGLLGAFARAPAHRLPEPRDQAALDVLRAVRRLATGAPPADLLGPWPPR